MNVKTGPPGLIVEGPVRSAGAVGILIGRVVLRGGVIAKPVKKICARKAALVGTSHKRAMIIAHTIKKWSIEDRSKGLDRSMGKSKGMGNSTGKCKDRDRNIVKVKVPGKSMGQCKSLSKGTGRVRSMGKCKGMDKSKSLGRIMGKEIKGKKGHCRR